MRVGAALTLLLALLVALATWSIIDVLSRLDGLLLQEELTFDMLLRGDVQSMVLLPVTWRNVPDSLLHGHWQVLLAWRPMLVMSLLGGLICWHWRRRGWALDWTAGLACLLASLLPWSFGRVMLTRIETPDECGPWLAFMLVSVFLGAGLGVILACRQFRCGSMGEAHRSVPIGSLPSP